MNLDDFNDSWDYREEESERRDPKIDEAKEKLMGELFEKKPEEVFYEKQVEVLFERSLFHWITAQALQELRQEGKIRSEKVVLEGPTAVRFYWSKRNRYWKRKAEEIRKLILEYSRSEFTRALGHHGEQMFDAALPTGGFMPRGRKVRGWAGKEWTKTGHDLDRVFERNGVAYGTEVKNTLSYIEREELEVKIEMCRWLMLRPLFIVRMAPKSYIEIVRQAGGFTLVFEWQLYPHGHLELAKRVRDRLGLRVDCPAAIYEGTVKRFLRWHEGLVGGGGL